MYRDNYVPKGDLDEEQLALLADVVKQAMYESGISASQQKVFTNVLERRLKAQEGVLVESTAHDIEEEQHDHNSKLRATLPLCAVTGYRTPRPGQCSTSCMTSTSKPSTT